MYAAVTDTFAVFAERVRRKHTRTVPFAQATGVQDVRGIVLSLVVLLATRNTNGTLKMNSTRSMVAVAVFSG